MNPVKKWMRVVSAQAMLLLVPAGLIIEVELVAQGASPALPEQKEQLAKTIDGLSSRRIACVKARRAVGKLTPYEAVDLVEDALSPTFHVNRDFQANSLFWSMENGLPLTGGTYAVYSASLPTQSALADFTDSFGLCRRIRDPSDAEEVKEVEEASQKWLDGRVAQLKALEQKLADARAAFKADRIPLAVLAWSLGLSQVFGWVLTVFVVLPRDWRALKERRAAKKALASKP